MKKVIGIVVSVIGLLALALTVKPVKEAIKLPEQIGDIYLIVGGLIIIVVGLILVKTQGSGRQAPEVPIYKGKKIVGYRRHLFGY